MAMLHSVSLAVVTHVLHRPRRSVSALAVLLLVLAIALRSLRRRYARGESSKGRSTLLTALRITGCNVQQEQAVVDSVLKPLERAAHKEPETPRTFAVHNHAVFHMGDSVRYICGRRGTVIGFDKDGDLKVATRKGHIGVWYGHKCWKDFTIGDRVRYNCGNEGVILGIDGEGDLWVRCNDGRVANWLLRSTTRLLSVGDRVQYICGQWGTVEGFDDDGDVKVLKPTGVRSVWYEKKCIQDEHPKDVEQREEEERERSRLEKEAEAKQLQLKEEAEPTAIAMEEP